MGGAAYADGKGKVIADACLNGPAGFDHKQGSRGEKAQDDDRKNGLGGGCQASIGAVGDPLNERRTNPDSRQNRKKNEG